MRSYRMPLLGFVFLFSMLLIADSGGPDTFGYEWVDSRESNGPDYEWYDISDIGERLSNSDIRDGVATVSLSRGFEYYGTEYSTVYVSDNGCITFQSTTYISPYVYGIPSTSSPNNLIAPFYGDLDPSLSPDPHGIYFYDTGDEAIFQWDNIGETYYASARPMTFQCVLHYSSRTIYFYYNSISDVYSHTYYIGHENNSATDGLLYGRYSSSYDFIEDELAIRCRATPVVEPPYFDICNYPDNFQIPDDTGWQIGTPSSGPGGAHSGSRCWGTNLSGDYEDGAIWTLWTPDLDFSDAIAPVVDFWHWYSFEDSRDGGICEVSTNGGDSWTVVEPEGGYPGTLSGDSPYSGIDAFTGTSGEWEKVSYDLVDYAGQLISFRFNMNSNMSTTEAGWYIDDLGVSQKFGVIKGVADLSYTSVDAGIEVTVVEDEKMKFTNIDGAFLIDSVTTFDDYTIRFERPGYVTDSLIHVNVSRYETTYVEIIMSPIHYESDFAQNNGGLSAYPAEGWQWGEPIPVMAPWASHSDSFCWGTNLEGNYSNAVNWTLDLPIELSPLDRPSLKFWSWYDFAGEYAGNLFDGGNVKVSNDGGDTWTVLQPSEYADHGYDGLISSHNTFMAGEPAFGGEGHGDFWHYQIFDLFDYVDETVLIRFQVGTDGMGAKRGWYIDDIMITDNWTSVEEPVENLIPDRIVMSSAPNPFNGAAEIRFTVPPLERFDGRIEIFDTRGIKIDMIHAEAGSGTHSVTWQPPENITSGLYIARVKTDKNLGNTRLLYIK